MQVVQSQKNKSQKITHPNSFNFLISYSLIQLNSWMGVNGNREYAFGHKYFSAEKSRDPDSRRRAPSFDSR